jgi:hypothetical protein
VAFIGSVSLKSFK